MSPIEQYNALEARIASLIPKFRFSKDINLKLERITHLLDLLGNPQRQFRSIHVGGTSGKGSTATMIATMLKQVGYKTGLHTSPNLQILNERHQIDGQVAPTSELLAIMEAMWPAIQQVGEDLPQFGLPSYFEAQLAMGCMWFVQHGVEVAVVEVGVGGRLDATNVLRPEVAVITSVGLDHIGLLGETIEEIIADKAGIIKPGQTVVTGVTQPSAHEIVADRADMMGNALWSLGREFDYEVSAEDETFNLFMPHGRNYFELELGVIGEFQRINAACAVAAVLAFDRNFPESAIFTGLKTVAFPGRLEVMQSRPTVVLDGAHNPDKMGAAAEAMAYSESRTIVVLAMKAGKELADTMLQLLPHADHVIATEFGNAGVWRSNSAETIAETIATLAPNMSLEIVHDPIAAVEHAIALANPADTVWVTGSLYLVGNVRNYWYPKEKLLESAETTLPASLII
ncbi:MAG: bifunctional folylpolyglutamate synthase/dihydrofolate synthase [Candidatus Promineifilaceae bacterium]